MKRLWLSLLFIAATMISAPLVPEANACSCIQPDIATLYNLSTDVMKVRILQKNIKPGQIVYRARVIHDYKGCKKLGSYVNLVTADNEAACGVNLPVNSTWLITGTQVGPASISIGLCGYNKPWDLLSKADLKFLNSRLICCGSTCICADGTQPVNCFVDPCMVASCPEGECVSNYCGGCTAESYDDFGQMVCKPCKSDADCPFFQSCSANGQCLSGCSSDEDCATDAWCRPTEDGTQECTPYAQEGDMCGGFVPIWALSKCAPGLVCGDVPLNIPDLPGVCLKPCKSNLNCDEDQYCALDGYCRDDGSCKMVNDCNLPGNSWPHILCVGFATCGKGQCGWQCGTPVPQCLDVSGIDFGDCEMALGWANLNGQCQMVSGCSTMGIQFYGSQLQCLEACGIADPCSELAGIDFGPCDAVLGVGILGGVCQTISGCDAGPFDLFNSMEECKTTCGAMGPTQWYSTCGDPVCSGWKPKFYPLCTSAQKEGEMCNTPGMLCDPKNFCNSLLSCTDTDPKLQPGGCPISRAEKKQNISYLNDGEVAKLSEQLMSFKLATWSYKAQGENAPTRLGFMIDDVEPSFAVDEKRDMVDLYGYLSMAVATLQVQADRIESLENKITVLEKELAAQKKPSKKTNRVK